MVYNYSFHTYFFIGDHLSKKIEAKDIKAMLSQTTCLLVVGSPSFWNAPNST
jgi:hypothetical protein